MKIKREPSIHIRISKLCELLQRCGIPVTESTIERVCLQARQHSLDHRSVLVDTKVAEKVISSRTKATIGDANLLADIIYSTRIKMKHIGVVKVKQTDTQWAQVKALVPTITQFCQSYNLNPRAGYIKFVELGLNLMSKSKKVNYNFCANWMLQKVDWILSTYQAEHILANDDNIEGTRYVHDIYMDNVLERTGIHNTYIKDPVQYINFYKAREVADRVGVDYEIYIKAQFEALAFCNGIPRIDDLCTSKAQERLATYISKNNITIVKPEERVSTSVWDEFKK